MQESVELQEYLGHLIQTIRTLFGLDRVSILLADPSGQWLTGAASVGVAEPLKAIQIPISPEGGALAHVYRTRQRVVWDGVASLPGPLRLQPPYDRIEALRSSVFAILPLVVHGRTIGVVGADRKLSRRSLDTHTLETLDGFTAHAALAIEQARLFTGVQQNQVEQQVRRMRELEASARIGTAVSSSLALHDVLDQALDTTLAILEMEAGVILLLDEEAGEVVLSKHRGQCLEAFVEISRFKLGEGFPGLAVPSGEILSTSELGEDLRFLRTSVVKAGFRTFASVPLKVKGKAIGTLEVAAKRSQVFTDSDLDLLTTIGATVGMAIGNARLYEEAAGRAWALEQKAIELAQAHGALVKSEKLRAMGQLASGVAHDFNNVLTGVLGQVMLLQARLEQGVLAPDELRQSLQLVKQAALDGAETVRKIREATRPLSEEAFGSVPLNKVVEQVIETAPVAPPPDVVSVLPGSMRVLVIDDDPMVAHTLGDLLRALGHEADVATSGAEGLERLATLRFDLLLTDLGMPGMSGWEVAKVANARWPELPVALVTGWGNQIEPAQLTGSGVDLVVAKPYELQVLRQVLGQARTLREKRRAEQRR